MCGIVGYIGNNQAIPILLEGLSSLEYRGYDSAGICIFDHEIPKTIKTKGPLSNLTETLNQQSPISSFTGIGHTRWATHGAPSQHNAHPHSSKEQLYTVVHNGIIENYIQLKEMLLEKGYRFQSETDTEVIAQLLYDNHTGDPLTTLQKTAKQLTGSYALAILYKHNPKALYAIRKESPLMIGTASHGNLISSDIPAMLPQTKELYLPEDHHLIVLTKEMFQIFTPEGTLVTPKRFQVDWTVEAAQKQGYEHFMQKEMQEQPEAVKKTISPRIKERKIVLDTIPLSRKWLNQFQTIQIVACGSAYHAGLVGKTILEEYTKIPTAIEIASEFRYRNTLTNPSTLFLAISQSGETADTLAALRKAKKMGATSIAICNVVGSSLAREADYVLYTHAGPEISVATTKAYSAQLAVLYLLALSFSDTLGNLSSTKLEEMISTINLLPELIETVVKDSSSLEAYAKQFHKSKHFFFIGRGLDSASGMEGALKLKEISYLPADSYPAGELKHGPISLIEEGTPVVVLATDESLFEKTLSNLKEVKARGAHVLLITTKKSLPKDSGADEVFYLPEILPLFMPSLSIVPLQSIAYHIAKFRGCDIDKPRNLAKSVTVE